MDGKWSIAVFLILCFAWQVKSAVTCAANGRYPDPADTSCKNYTLCVARSNGSFIGYNYICPSTSLFNPAIAQCTTNYVCNVTTSVCTTEGFFADPNGTNCSTFISCVNGPTNAAFTCAGSPFQHLGTPTSIGSPNYVPCPLPLQLCDSLRYVGNSGFSTDLLIPDLIT
ncbi:jg11209 [Pararge aegeria aegeria]|uniref:Jg11209 protein n=1 Tax=Pararge aegeria aegeria TaxID=348720 RepID=A0A8S4RK66_9NEOP|nr:jg11209 [Pararge aegeria aegeria]